MPKPFHLISSAHIFQLHSLLRVLFTFSVHLTFSVLAHLITLIFGGGEGGGYELQNFSVCNILHLPSASPSLCRNISLCTLKQTPLNDFLRLGRQLRFQNYTNRFVNVSLCALPFQATTDITLRHRMWIGHGAYSALLAVCCRIWANRLSAILTTHSGWPRGYTEIFITIPCWLNGLVVFEPRGSPSYVTTKALRVKKKNIYIYIYDFESGTKSKVVTTDSRIPFSP